MSTFRDPAFLIIMCLHETRYVYFADVRHPNG